MNKVFSNGLTIAYNVKKGLRFFLHKPTGIDPWAHPTWGGVGFLTPQTHLRKFLDLGGFRKLAWVKTHPT